VGIFPDLVMSYPNLAASYPNLTKSYPNLTKSYPNLASDSPDSHPRDEFGRQKSMHSHDLPLRMAFQDNPTDPRQAYTKG
jgi:hypothetical protein